jgi:phospholipase A-2-activating protein
MSFIIDNPYAAAQKFIWDHELSQEHLDQIANFIIQNAKGVEIGMNNSDYVDPYTGSSRYTPGNPPATEPTLYSDPYTGIHNFEFSLQCSVLLTAHHRFICL